MWCDHSFPLKYARGSVFSALLGGRIAFLTRSMVSSIIIRFASDLFSDDLEITVIRFQTFSLELMLKNSVNVF